MSNISTDQVWGQNYDGIEIKSDERVHSEIAKVLQRLFPDRTSAISVLDIASGHGALTKRVQDLYPNWSFQINDLEHTNPISRVTTSTIDLNSKFGSSLPKFDVVLCVEVIEHLESPWNLLRELRTIVKPGAIVILSTPNSDSLLDRIEYLKHGHAFYFGERGFINSGGHITPVPDWLFRKIAAVSGFEVSELNSVSTKPFIRKYMLPAQLLLTLYLKILRREFNNRSINIYILKCL